MFSFQSTDLKAFSCFVPAIGKKRVLKLEREAATKALLAGNGTLFSSTSTDSKPFSCLLPDIERNSS